MNILFVCSRNEWRSRTAETIFKNHPIHHVKSAGTQSNARIRVNMKLISWADIILVMEKKHKARINHQFFNLLEHTPLYVLDILDEYKYMDEELIAELKCLAAQFVEDLE